MLPCSVMHLSTWQTHRVLVGTCSQLRLNYKTSWTTRNPAKPQPEDWSAAVWQENYCWVELLPQCLSWWLKWPSLSGSILLNCISCTTQPANHSGMPLGILALAVFSQLQYCSPGLFSVISVGGLSFPREIVNNRAHHRQIWNAFKPFYNESAILVEREGERGGNSTCHPLPPEAPENTVITNVYCFPQPRIMPTLQYSLCLL